jgi:hypothetical protein
VPRVALALVVLVAAACGGRAAAPTPLWRANTRDVVHQLRADLAAVDVAGDTLPDARGALASTSDLYALLTAYSDLGGCRAMVSATQAPAPVVRRFAGACVHLERAAALFEQAVKAGDAAVLVRATREARGAQPALVAAAAAAERR